MKGWTKWAQASIPDDVPEWFRPQLREEGFARLPILDSSRPGGYLAPGSQAWRMKGGKVEFSEMKKGT